MKAITDGMCFLFYTRVYLDNIKIRIKNINLDSRLSPSLREKSTNAEFSSRRNAF